VGEEEYTLGNSITEGKGSFSGQTARSSKVAVAMEREEEKRKEKEKRISAETLCT
jgi:hypothetical protein